MVERADVLRRDTGVVLRRSRRSSAGNIQQRDGRWVFVNVAGKEKRIRIDEPEP